MWTLWGSVSYYSAFCRRAESLSLASTCRGETDRQGGGEPPHLWVSLLPRKPCLAYLTPVSDDITCQDCPLTMRDSLQCPAWTQRQATGECMCVWVCVYVGGGVSVITMTKNYWGRNTGMQFISSVNPRRSVGGPTQSSSSDREGYICFCLLCMWLVSLPVFPISAKMLCGREVGELSLLGLIY